MRHGKFWIPLCILVSTPVLLRAQWLNHPTAGVPRTPDGKPNLSAPAPHAPNGKPDLSGLWMTNHAPSAMLERLIPGATNGAGEEPLSHCLPEGMPMLEMSPAPYKIIPTPGMTIMLYERDTTYRQIYTDGRTLPGDPDPSWLGYSVGKWEGDTFVVSSIGFNDRGWLDARGHTHTESLRLTERFHRPDFGHMEVQLTVDDPKTYSRPFTIQLLQSLVPDSDLLESFCAENEKDMRHIPGK